MTRPDTDMFPRGTVVFMTCSRTWASLPGIYWGHAGQRWDGEHHRIKLADGRTRYVGWNLITRPGLWAHEGGLLYRWRHAETLEELRV